MRPRSARPAPPGGILSAARAVPREPPADVRQVEGYLAQLEELGREDQALELAVRFYCGTAPW